MVGNQMRTSSSNSMEKMVRSSREKTPSAELQLLMMISQDNLLSKRKRRLIAPLMNHMHQLLLPERTDLMEKLLLIGKLKSYKMMEMLLMDSISTWVPVNWCSNMERQKKLLKLLLSKRRMMLKEMRCSVSSFQTLLQQELNFQRKISFCAILSPMPVLFYNNKFLLNF
jgi:hypothetical protein